MALREIGEPMRLGAVANLLINQDSRIICPLVAAVRVLERHGGDEKSPHVECKFRKEINMNRTSERFDLTRHIMNCLAVILCWLSTNAVLAQQNPGLEAQSASDFPSTLIENASGTISESTSSAFRKASPKSSMYEPLGDSGSRLNVFITSPIQGSFVIGPTVAVEGYIEGGRRSNSIELTINGISTPIGEDGRFSTNIPVDSAAVFNAVLAEATLESRVATLTARDRVTVIAGRSVPVGTTIRDAVAVHVTESGFNPVQLQIVQELLNSGLLDIRGMILAENPIWGEYSDDFYAVVEATNAGFNCPTIEFNTQSSRLEAAATLYAPFVEYHAEAGMDLMGADIDVDCSGRFAADLASLSMGLTLSVNSHGRIDVRQPVPNPVSIPNLYNVFYDGPCDWPGIDDLLNGIIRDTALSKVQAELYKAINGLNDQFSGFDPNSAPIPHELEKLLNTIDLGSPIGAFLDVDAEADFSSITITSSGLGVGLGASLRARKIHNDAPNITDVYSSEDAVTPFGSTSPELGRPYDLGMKIRPSILNQLLAAETMRGLLNQTIDLNEFTSNPGELEAQSLAALSANPGDGELVARFRPTLAPIIAMLPAEGGQAPTLMVSHLLFEVAYLRPDEDSLVIFSAAVDLSVPVDVAFESSGNVRFSANNLSQDAVQITLLQTPPRVDLDAMAAAISAGLSELLGQIMRSLDSFPIPTIGGLRIRGVESSQSDPFVGLYFELEASLKRPDLVVSNIRAPRVIDRNTPFRIDFSVTNQGTQTAYGGIQIGASLSLDQELLSFNEAPLGRYGYALPANGLRPGQSASYSLMTSPVFGATFARQHLFVCADLPPYIAPLPFVGVICESAEYNNCTSIPIEVSAPDAWIESVTPPEGLVGGEGARGYEVTVCRNEVGPPELYVPVGVAVGNPPIFFAQDVVPIRPNDCETHKINLLTPDSFGPCGGSNIFPVTACANLVDDRVNSNDCENTGVRIDVPRFDLRYYVEGPNSAPFNSAVEWTVTICNEGNIGSPLVCSRTCIGNDDGDNYLSCAGGTFRPFNVLPLAKDTCTPPLRFSAMLSPGATRHQFIKAGVDTVSNCFDVCTEGNQTDKPLTIDFPDLVVRNVSAPNAICGTQSFDGGFDICNVGGVPASGTFTVGGWVSADGNPFDFDNEIDVGDKLITLSPALAAGDCRHYSIGSLDLPPNPYLMTQHFVVCADIYGPQPCNTVCEGNEQNNCGSVEVDVVPLDVAVLDVAAPSSVYGCNGPRTYTTKVRNNSDCAVHNVQVRTCVGVLPQVSCGNHVFSPCVIQTIGSIGPGATIELRPSIPTPPAFGACGQRIPFTLSALLLNWGDFNNGNNVRNENMYITVPCADNPGDGEVESHDSESGSDSLADDSESD